MKYRHLLLSLALLLVACGQDEPRDSPAADNLGFEQGTLDGWDIAGEGFDASLDTELAQGRASLAFDLDRLGNYAVASHEVPVVGPYVRVKGAVSVRESDAGWGGIWARAEAADGSLLSADKREFRVFGDTVDWRLLELTLEVPPETTRLVVGALVEGNGRAWIDTFSAVVAEQPAEDSVVVSGRVLDEQGQPVADALVMAEGRSESQRRYTRTDRDGAFGFYVDDAYIGITSMVPGTGHATRYFAFPGQDVSTDLYLEQGTQQISGSVVDEAGQPVVGETVVLELSDYSRYAVTLGNQGRFVANIPDTESIRLFARSEKHLVEESFSFPAESYDGIALSRNPAPEETLAWVQEQAIPLTTALPGQGFEDMEPLREVVGEARVVGMGESTHGGRQDSLFKHRMFEFLVTELGFNIFAIEITWPESVDLNRYLLTGDGNPEDLLSGMYFYIWDTEEMLGLIEWMRAYNADPSHERKVQFVGVDMQFTPVATTRLLSYLREVDPGFEAEVRPRLEFLARQPTGSETRERGPELLAATMDAEGRLDDRREAYIGASSANAWRRARHEAEILRQYVETLTGSSDDPSLRDRFMARNLEWILEEDPTHKVMLWAHNRHVGFWLDGPVSQGEYLRRSLGTDYVAVGFTFYEGAHHGEDRTGRTRDERGLVIGEVAAAAPGSIEALFHRTGLSSFALDLRGIPEGGPVAEWLAAPRPVAWWGDAVGARIDLEKPEILREQYDAVIFFDEMEAARTTRYTEPIGGLPRLSFPR